MEVLYPRCAGLDVHKDTVVACASHGDGAVRREVRTFKTTTKELLALSEWLTTEGCTHVAMEMDWQPNRFFDDTGNWLLCGTHGAAYHPDTGACAGGPCRGSLVRIGLTESGGIVHWHTAWNLQPISF